MGREVVDREKRVGQLLAAAERIFMRFGFNRTTMGLLAEEAGISRPSAYLLFANKEEIFSALVLDLNRRQLDLLANDIAPKAGLRDKLLKACSYWNESVFDIHNAHPEARDMDNLAFPAVRALYDELGLFFATIIEDAEKAGRSDAEIKGRTLAFAARGCRRAARDRAEMTAMIHTLVEAIAPENIRSGQAGNA